MTTMDTQARIDEYAAKHAVAKAAYDEATLQCALAGTFEDQLDAYKVWNKARTASRARATALRRLRLGIIR